MDFDSINSIKANSFKGFTTIGELFIDYSDVDDERGNYLVLYLTDKEPEFVYPGVGGFFKVKDPNVPVSVLQSNWVYGTIVVNIGQAGGIRAGKWSEVTLHGRIGKYLRFGKGKNVSHKGGRYIWQLKDYKDLVLCWKPWPNKMRDPKEVESQMLQDFKNIYGKLPFANLKG